jgi:H+/Cl- antiporter ClcA
VNAGEQPDASAVASSADPTSAGSSPADDPAADPTAAIRTKRYLGLLVLAALLGVPLAAGAWGFLQCVDQIQKAAYTRLPTALGFHGQPLWWPLVPMAVAGVLVAATIRYLPGNAGHQPAEGLKTGGAAPARELPGILIAALASISLGAVIGPEAPLIALGGGLAAWAVRAAKRGAEPDPRVVEMAGATGSFAAISALLGSPLLGAFLLMEASGLGGPLLGVVLLPGLLASGVGALVFIGLNSWTGLPADTLTIPDLPAAGQPDLAEFGWALAIGVAAGLAGYAVRRGGLYLQARVIPRPLLLTPLIGLVVAGLAIGYAQATGKPTSDVLFSGETTIGPLISASAHYTAAALALLFLVKGLAYCVSLSAFRGGSVFPSMFLGAAGGIALSHLPGLSLVPGIAMGIGALAAAMLALPLTAVLLATLLLGKAGLGAMPLVIVAVVTSHVVSVRLAPAKAGGGSATPAR